MVVKHWNRFPREAVFPFLEVFKTWLRIIEYIVLERTFKGHLVQPPCNEQGQLPSDQVAESPVQPDSESFQRWGIYHLSV